ncbi:hypothetical protein EYF80_027276 [Liparis tanakae]|uniref:Uncharacterized protein n=1 Tax=Liparis tanakae TaxID=230148 RepID=A0A4Z2HBU2_9TELE|nr:hypothetical protein EYF80_027276 [Liparis tanakae]
MQDCVVRLGWKESMGKVTMALFVNLKQPRGAMLFPRCDEIKRNNSRGSFVEFATKDPTASPRLLAALDGRSDAAIQPVEGDSQHGHRKAHI